ncbi:hypothetical protein [Streptomyces virginiae]|nr:hypothetical protein [Streptomyces virginiae]MCX5174451.1 hypothetical protein [Streptomyces virginiae]
MDDPTRKVGAHTDSGNSGQVLAVDPAWREALLQYAASFPNARITYDPTP